MDYDFFGEDNQQQEENNTQRAPAPMEVPVKPHKTAQRNVKKTILSLGLALVIFLSGMLATWMLLDPQMRSLVTVKRKIQNNY